ncbi:secondary thiamine-phosphate synthase enzyme YjbQ [Serratia fonticola]|uniref:secondary thiamine-phosphate synthase enzyme YjbQ n=1 Tax=Serratia fonticola TaxID=47917 RepID=UPI00192D0FC5|nr:secondary thiamine-phosphate synthase enzyme YjbQ [Serratia fonticola]MBL5825696.1 YjbQ family protein [Serratia fonticola]
MNTYHKVINIKTEIKISFEDITEQVQQCLKESKISNGIVTVFSQHTSCTVFIQEDSEDITYQKVPLILQDMVNALEKIFPTCQYEGQYLHPGPIHTQRAMELRDEKSEWMLNTDGHLRSVLLGRSETIPVLDGEMTLGEFGRIYFSDMDQTRARSRMVRVQIIGH